MMKHRLLVAVSGLAVLVSTLFGAAGQDSFSGKAAEVSKGGVLQVSAETVRVAGVDCPELAQPFGPQAKEFTAKLTQDQDVTVKAQGKDEDGRTIAVVTLPDGTDLGQSLVGEGLGWCYEKDKPFDTALRGLMAKAIAIKKGLWADAAPLAPWDFRADAAKKKAKVAKADPAEDEGAQTVYVSTNSKDFHKVSCVFLDQSKKDVKRKDAVRLGYSKCPRCYPSKADEDAAPLASTGKFIKGEEETPVAKTADAAPAKKDELAKIKEDPIYKQINPTWKKDANGKVVGVTADGLMNTPYGAIAMGLGFQPGDVIQAINGESLTSEAQMMGLVEKYKNDRQFSVHVIRNGQPQDIDIDLTGLPIQF